MSDVLRTYWDVIPAHVITALVQRIYNDLAFDAAVDVRQAVFKVSCQHVR